MSKLLPTLFVHVGLALCLAGCNSEASQQAEAQRHLDAAQTKLTQANAGYVPKTSESDKESIDLLAYRQETMNGALDDLNKIMSLNAPPQQVQALQKMAEINSSAALYAAGQAEDENAVLSGRSTSLLGFLSAMEGSTIRSAALQPQTDESLAKLQAEIETQTAKRDELVDQTADLKTKLDAVTAEVDKFMARADEGNAQAQALHEQAFVASGDVMYDLQDQATELERKAAIESAAGEQRQVTANDLASRLALAQGQLDTTNQLIDELAGQVKATRADTQRQADASAQAGAESVEATKALAEEFDQIVDVHENAIQSRMTDAGEKIDNTVTDLKQAVGIAGKLQNRETAPMVRLQLLAAYVDQAHVASTHAMYLDDLAGTTETLALSMKRVSPADAEPYEQQAAQLREAQNALTAKANEAIAAGEELALELAPEGSTPEDGDIEALALKQQTRLAAYKARLAKN